MSRRKDLTKQSERVQRWSPRPINGNPKSRKKKKGSFYDEGEGRKFTRISGKCVKDKMDVNSSLQMVATGLSDALKNHL